MTQKLGILGGTFNPIHYGHLAAAEEVRSRLNLDRVLIVPSFLPPHKQESEISSAAQRMDMIRLAVLGNPHLDPSDIEIRRGGKSYSIDTLEGLRRDHPGAELYFIIGLDSFLEIETWHDWRRLFQLCFVVVLSRPGYCFSDLKKIDFMRNAEPELVGLDSGSLQRATIRTDELTIYLEMIPLYDISSTDIRKRVKEGVSIKYLLPEPVEIYIIANKLYA